MTRKQLVAYKVLLVGCGSPTSGTVNSLSQRWTKGWLTHHWLFPSLFSLALMCLFLSIQRRLPSLSLHYYPLSISISVNLLPPFSLYSWLPVFLLLCLSFLIVCFPLPLHLYSPSLMFFSPPLQSFPLPPSLPPEQSTTGPHFCGINRLW